MNHPDFNHQYISEEYLFNNIGFAEEIKDAFDHAKEMNASWYGPKKSFLITSPMLHGNGFRAKKVLRMKQEKRGGKRKGSGRPKLKSSEKKEQTKVMRIPDSKVDEVKKIIKRA